MKEREMVQVAEFIHRALESRADDAKLVKLKTEVKDFCGKFIFYK